jgi:hypothetical protein
MIPYLLALLCGLSSLMILFLGFYYPCQPVLDADSIGLDQNDIIQGGKVSGNIPSLDAFRKVWSKPLQKPLLELPPKKTPEEDRSPKPEVDIKLHGLVYEEGFERAIISINGNRSRLYAEGDVIAEGECSIKIISITEDRLTIQYDQEIVVIEMDEKKDVE